eukprot:jgi/Chrzof1/13563/Cz08g02080.t1
MNNFKICWPALRQQAQVLAAHPHVRPDQAQVDAGRSMGPAPLSSTTASICRSSHSHSIQQHSPQILCLLSLQHRSPRLYQKNKEKA